METTDDLPWVKGVKQTVIHSQITTQKDKGTNH